MTHSILFWSAAAAALFLAVRSVLARRGLCMRVRLRESATVLIAAGAAAGLLQLILHIPQTALKIALTVLWGIGLLAGLQKGLVIFAFAHMREQKSILEGKPCIIEVRDTVNGCSLYYCYEAHGPLTRRKERLNADIRRITWEKKSR